MAAAADIVAGYAHRATFFLITYLGCGDDIISLCRQLGVNMVQLHGPIALDELRHLRSLAPELAIIKSLIVGRDDEPALEADVARYASSVDAFITDTYDPATDASGATGQVHDWTVSKRLVALSSKPVILAGGLTAGNVAHAIADVRPAGVDVHTGLEGPDGRKRTDLTSRFIAEASAAFERLERR